jgi:type I restriction enzyme, S subunit
MNVLVNPYGKQFESFKVPEEWEIKSLDKICNLITDGSHFSPSKNGVYPLATVENMEDDKIDVDSCYKISEEDYEQLVKNNCKPEKNDVLYSKDGTVGLCLVYNQLEKIVLLSSIAIIRGKEDELDPYFCKYILKSRFMDVYLNKFKSGTALKRIILKEIAQFKFPLPKIEEQEEIGKILRNFDVLLKTKESHIEQLKKLKEGLVQKLYFEGLKHESFQNVEYIYEKSVKIPKSWDYQKLENIIDLKNGYAFKSEYFVKHSDKILLTPGNFHVEQYVYFQPRNTTYYDGPIPNGFELSNGDLLIVMTDLTRDGAILGNGIILENKKAVLHNQRIGKVIPKKKFDQKFLLYFLNSYFYKLQIKKTAAGTGVIHTSSKNILDCYIPLPKIEEQEEIGNIIYNVDNIIQIEKSRLKDRKKMKVGLMQKLLTGKIRVKV